MIAACDTFRSGAVEQLKTHCTRLGVPLYERGYEKDPAKVASEAVRAARDQKRDVVLVDTAGRMQVRWLLLLLLMMMGCVFEGGTGKHAGAAAQCCCHVHSTHTN